MKNNGFMSPKNLTQKQANDLLKLARSRILKKRDQILDDYNNKKITKEQMEKMFKADPLLSDTTELDQVIKENE